MIWIVKGSARKGIPKNGKKRSKEKTFLHEKHQSRNPAAVTPTEEHDICKDHYCETQLGAIMLKMVLLMGLWEINNDTSNVSPVLGTLRHFELKITSQLPNTIPHIPFFPLLSTCLVNMKRKKNKINTNRNKRNLSSNY